MPRQMPPLMSPPSIEPTTSDELLATTQTSNPTQTLRSKRPIAADVDEFAEGADTTAWDKARSAIEEDVGRLNKRFKDAPFVLQLIQSSRSIDPILAESDVINQSVDHASSGAGGVGDSSEPMDHAVRAHQGQRDEHPTSRPSLSTALSSSLSNVESQVPTVFSPQTRTVDSQSVYSQGTAPSTYTTAAGKWCSTCVKLLEKGYFSEWKNHFWPKHYPQDIYYCLHCKLGIVKDEEQGMVYWQCKKCQVIFQDNSTAVLHFTDRSGPCYQRGDMWRRVKPWKDHLNSRHIIVLLDGVIICDLCYETIPDTAGSKKHECPKLNEWRNLVPASVYIVCEDHGSVLTSYDQVNHHYEIEHFKQSGPRSRRSRTNAGSTIGDEDSRHDTHSLDGIDPNVTNQQDHSYMMTSHATPADSEAMFHQQIQAERQPCNVVKDPAVDLREMGRKSTLQNLQYPQGDMTVGDETGPSLNQSEYLVAPAGISSVREPPRLLTNVVTEDGKARFLKRKNTP